MCSGHKDLFKRTGLTWQQDYNHSAMSWEEALTYCEDLEFPIGNWTDWRLPNIKELNSITDRINYTIYTDIIYKYFNIVNNNYWSSTGNLYFVNDAYTIIGANGPNTRTSKYENCFVRCVRGGQ